MAGTHLGDSRAGEGPGAAEIQDFGAAKMGLVVLYPGAEAARVGVFYSKKYNFLFFMGGSLSVLYPLPERRENEALNFTRPRYRLPYLKAVPQIVP